MRYRRISSDLEWMEVSYKVSKEKGYEELEYFLARGADPETMILLITRGDSDSRMVELLISYGLDTDNPDILIAAIELCDLELFKRFLTPEYDLSRTTYSYLSIGMRTPLKSALFMLLYDRPKKTEEWYHRMLRIIEILLERDAPIEEYPDYKEITSREYPHKEELIKLLNKYEYKERQIETIKKTNEEEVARVKKASDEQIARARQTTDEETSDEEKD